MNLAWNELVSSVIKAPVQLKSNKSAVVRLLSQFNNPVLTKDDLSNDSYYVKAGFGQKTVDTINKDMKEKFNSSFG